MHILIPKHSTFDNYEIKIENYIIDSQNLSLSSHINIDVYIFTKSHLSQCTYVDLRVIYLTQKQIEITKGRKDDKPGL